MPLSGKEMLKLYLKSGWKIISQKGSHIKISKDNERETIPMHKELHTGIEKYLLKRLAKSEEEK